MAIVYLTEFASLSADAVPAAQCAKCPPLAEQVVNVTGSHLESAAFSAQTHVVRVHTDAICSILINSAPVATATHMRLAANQTEYFAVNPGDKLSVITNT